MGKKSDSIPAIVNSMLPLVLDASMTGSLHSRICFLESNLYSPTTSPTTGEPTPLLNTTRRWCVVCVCEREGGTEEGERGREREEGRERKGGREGGRENKHKLKNAYTHSEQRSIKTKRR